MSPPARAPRRSTEAEELRRVVPVVEALAADGRAGLDRHPQARRGPGRGGGGRHAAQRRRRAPTARVAAELGVAWAAMHMQGEPATMQDDPRYDDVVAEVLDRPRRAGRGRRRGRRARGVDRPGHRLRQDARAQPRAARPPRRLRRHRATRCSSARAARGSSGACSATPTAPTRPRRVDDRLEGSLATATWAMASGARMVRVHDVRATAHAALVIGGQITKDAA